MKNNMLDEIKQVFSQADCLWSEKQLVPIYDNMASMIKKELATANPLVLCVMNGGLIPTGVLLTRLNFPMQVDYLHATRYRGATEGGQLDWRKRPEQALSGRSVLVIDDILDEGYTLQAILQECEAMGAREVASCVVVEKQHGRNCGIEADFVGLKVPDRYVFGFGMDYKTYGRNLNAIYAVKDA